VDKYQGQQNDYVLLSLVRTESVGHLRDVRRLIVAASRARLGLYVFCRQSLFEGVHELQPTFSRLLTRSSTLEIIKGELWPCSRSVADVVPAQSVGDVTAMGLIVYQMTVEAQARVKADVALVAASTAMEVTSTLTDTGGGGNDEAENSPHGEDDEEEEVEREETSSDDESEDES
jgi:intron-binding protein aquarius